MKRTLTFSLVLAMTALAVAQTPTAAKSAASGAKPKTEPQVVSAGAKPSPAAVKAVAVGVGKSSPVVAKPTAVPAQPSTTKPAFAAASSLKPGAKKAKAGPVSVQPVAAKPASAAKSEAKAAAPAVKDPFSGRKKIQALDVKAAAPAKPASKGTKASGEAAPVVAKKIGAAGRRDPFVSPVMMLSAFGSGCNSGKRCLNIEQIALRGVVRSDTGMIAVVVNALDKAYFLREHDPVFNGFVEKITADSIVFKQTFHDKLGKPLTRDVTKTISRPAA